MMIYKTGNRNAPTPKNCSSKSERTAPTMPIQLRAACEPVSTEALFSEGSRGEYEASARKRRSAETHNRNPTSSLSRRLLVGTKMRAKDFMWASSASSLAPNDTRTRDARSTPEPVDYAKNIAARQIGRASCRG